MTDEVVATLAGVIVGGLIGFGSGYVLDRLRENRERKGDSQDMAAALMGEVKGWLYWWDQASAQCTIKKETTTDKAIACIAIAGKESLFTVFDSAGPRLSLLPRDLIRDTVECYAAMKLVMDGFRGVEQAIENALRIENNDQRARLSNATGERAGKVIKNAQETSERASQLAERLEGIAKL